MFARSEGTPKLLKTVEEKQNTAFIPDSCCKAKRADPMKTTAKYGSDKEIMKLYRRKDKEAKS